LSCEEKLLIYDEEWQEREKNPHTIKESRGIAWGVGSSI